MTDDFRLVILRSDLEDLKLGYTYDDAFPKLLAAGKEPPLFVVEVDLIAAYHWDIQSILLTAEGTQKLLAALEPPEDLKESVRALTGMRARLGWGDRLDHALYTKGFLVLIGEELLYGGIFLDATSQRAIDYPVIRASLSAEGQARFNLLPIHVAFFTQDPATCGEGAGDEGVAREMANDWRQFPRDVKALFQGRAAREPATTFRALMRSDVVRAILESAGKLA
jgi:hypothetical protein